MAKNKKLTSSAVKNKREELKASLTKEVVVGADTYEFKIDRKFLKSKEVAFTNDLISFISEVSSDEKYFDLGQARIKILSENFALLMLIKHFTSIDVPADTDEALTVLNNMADLGIFGEIVNSFPEDEVERVMKNATVEIDDFNSKLEESLNKLREQTDKLEKELQDGEKLYEELTVAELEDNGVIVEEQ